MTLRIAIAVAGAPQPPGGLSTVQLDYLPTPHHTNAGDLQQRLLAFIRTNAKRGNIHTIEVALRDMYMLGFDVDETVMRHVVQGCIRAKRLDKVELHGQSMIANGSIRSIEMYNIMLNAYASLGSVHDAEMWIMRMIERGIELDAVSYATFCKALARTGQTHRIAHTMAYVEQRGLHVNEYFYACLIMSCCHRTVDEQRLLAILRSFSSRGFRVHRLRRILMRTIGVHATESVLRQLQWGR